MGSRRSAFQRHLPRQTYRCRSLFGMWARSRFRPPDPERAGETLSVGKSTPMTVHQSYSDRPFGCRDQRRCKTNVSKGIRCRTDALNPLRRVGKRRPKRQHTRAYESIDQYFCLMESPLRFWPNHHSQFESVSIVDSRFEILQREWKPQFTFG